MNGSSRLESNMQELLDRTRRIETRVTKFLQSQGFDTGVQRPAWANGVIVVPSKLCGLKEIMAVIPRDWDPEKPIKVMNGSELVVWMHVPKK